MVGQNEATSSSELRPQVIRTGAAALVSGRIRRDLGRLILSDHELRFVPDKGEDIVMPLADIAWLDISPRARQLTLEVTMRGAVIRHLRIAQADWLTSLRRARERAAVVPAGGVHHQPMSLAG
jgi:hypothetical protein